MKKNVTFIKEIESPFKLRPNKIVKILEKKIIGFNITIHTKYWKYYKVRPRKIEKAFNGEFSAYDKGQNVICILKNGYSFLEKSFIKKQPI